MMILAILGLHGISLIDLLDIVLVALLIYLALKWLRGSAAMSIFLAIMILCIIWLAVSALGMKMMNSLMSALFDVGILSIIILFQPEIRRFMISLGNRYRNAYRESSLLQKIIGNTSRSVSSENIGEIVDACMTMSAGKVGALIVLPHFNNLSDIINTGDRIDAQISSRLLQNLFFKNSPLHDGAIIISGNRIVAARCTLPITEKTDIPASFGMRHKAAVGISETSDADVIVVSEETGGITCFKDGEATRINNANDLRLLLTKAMDDSQK